MGCSSIVPVASLFYISYNNIRIDNRYLSRRMVKKFLYPVLKHKLWWSWIVAANIQKYNNRFPGRFAVRPHNSGQMLVNCERGRSAKITKKQGWTGEITYLDTISSNSTFKNKKSSNTLAARIAEIVKSSGPTRPNEGNVAQRASCDRKARWVWLLPLTKRWSLSARSEPAIGEGANAFSSARSRIINDI